MIMLQLRLFLLIKLLLPLVFLNGSEAAPFLQMFHRKLGDFTHHSISLPPASAPTHSTSPPGVNKGLVGVLTQERCPLSQPMDSTRICHDQLHHLNFTSCLIDSSTSPGELYLLVQNDGEDLLAVNVTILDTKLSFPEIKIPPNETKKFNISTIVKGSPSLILNAGNGACIVHIGSEQSNNKFYKHLSAYASNLRPVHGAYFLFLTALVVGGICACCKLGGSDRHVKGVRYQELEMGQPEPMSHTASSNNGNNVGTEEKWDEGWDDEWEDTMQVKPLNGHQTETPTSKASEDGWENYWND